MLKLFEFREAIIVGPVEIILALPFLDGPFFCTTFSVDTYQSGVVIIAITLLGFATIFSSCSEKTITFNGKALGTTWTVKIRASRYLDRSVLKDEIISTIEEAEKSSLIGVQMPNCINSAKL